MIDQALAQKLGNMVHFRNTITHACQRTDLEIVKSVITSNLDDLVLFGDRVREFFKGQSA